MSGDRWQRVNDLFHAALEREGAARDAFLREACGADQALFDDVLSLIAADSAPPAVPLERLGEHAAAHWASGQERVSLVGRRVDRYQVIAHLGSGGMGEVYRATDSVLGRDVALKVLAPALHSDVDFRRRLEKEARAASSLNHPNIVTVYEIGQAGELDFVASELVDGVTLRDRLAAGPLSMRELVDVGAQIAAALATAHGSGIVHRDIKPENVMIRRDGIVKVVDFGLAKRTDRRSAGGLASAAAVLTQPGVVAGTACYMSPEQALGDTIDQRSDLFSVGILLYEMATGQRPFTGASDVAMYDALLHTAPPAPTTLRGDLPIELDLVIGRALEKDRELRYQSAADLGADLKRLHRPSTSGALAAAPAPKTRRAQPWRTVAIAALGGAAALAVALVMRRAPEEAPLIRFTLGPPPDAAFTPIGRSRTGLIVSVSPDGRHVLYGAQLPGAARGRLWIRSIDSVDPRPLDDTDGATNVCWSPDSRSIAFFTGPDIRRKEIAGGPARTIGNVSIPRGCSWGRDGVILAGSGSLSAGIVRMTAEGGPSSAVTTPDAARGESSHAFPQWLPDGRHFLYLAMGKESHSVVAATLDRSVKTPLFETAARASYADPGFLFFVDDAGMLTARPFDPARLTFTGDELRLGCRVRVASTAESSFAIGGTTLACAERTGEASRLTWFDRSGQRIGTVGAEGQYVGVRLSPDGQTAAIARTDAKGAQPDVWLVDLPRGVESRFTFTPTFEGSPVWSPDGSRVLFAGTVPPALPTQVFQRPAAGGAEPSRVFTTEDSVIPEDWSPDGQFIVYTNDQPANDTRIRLLRVRDLQSTVPAASGFSEYGPRISPDGRWLAYTSEESGRPEVYLRRFPTGPSTIVSSGAGAEPSWRRDGKELFYLAPSGAVMSVALSLGETVNAGKPSELFRAPFPPDRQRIGTSYAVTPDGQRFLIPVVAGDRTEPGITVVMDWKQSLGR